MKVLLRSILMLALLATLLLPACGSGARIRVVHEGQYAADIRVIRGRNWRERLNAFAREKCGELPFRLARVQRQSAAYGITSNEVIHEALVVCEPSFGMVDGEQTWDDATEIE